jgi:hypothetical protein
MLEKDPAARHPNLRDAERFFRRLVPDEHSATTQLAQASLRKPIEASRPAEVVVAAPTAPATPTRGPRSWPLVAAGVGLGAVLVAAAVMLRSTPPVAQKTTPPTTSETPPTSGVTARQSTTDSSAKQVGAVGERSVTAAATVVPSQQQTTQVPTAATEPTTKPAIDSGVRADTTSMPARPQGEAQPRVIAAPPPPPPASVATVADARAVASEFLTWCNHRQWRDVERLPSLEGSAELRTELIRLIRSATDFQAGFERLASRPVVSERTFTTDFILDLEWRGGQRQLEVTVTAELTNGAWHLAGFGVHPPD